MLYIHFFALSGIFAIGASLRESGRKKAAFSGCWFAALFCGAFMLRLGAAALSKGFHTDTACFASWAERICQTGPGGFYSPEVFTDYPPGYIYVLWLVGGLRRLLGLGYYSAAHLLLLKLPAILGDMACGLLLCREASAKVSPRQAFFLCAAYLFNPAVILNSSVWGQVDSLFTLATAVMCLCLIRGKIYPGLLAFGAGLLIKPQMLLFGPVLLAGMIDWVFPKGSDGSLREGGVLTRLFCCIGQGLSVILGCLLLCLPFGLEKVLTQILSTLGSYPYAAVNACNVWGLLGLNWISQDNRFLGIPYQVFGWTAIVVFVALTLYLSLRNRDRQEKYPFLAAFLVVSVFLFSVRMHERYLYPGLALLLLAYLYLPSRLLAWCYGGFSVMHFYNTANVLFFYDPSNYDRKAPAILLVSAGMLLCGGILYYTAYRLYGGGRSGALPAPGQDADGLFPSADFLPRNSHRALPLTGKDVLCMLTVTAIYSCFALYDLGEHTAPVTAFPMDQGQSVELRFPEAPASLSYYMAPWHNRTFLLEGRAADGTAWSPAEEVSFQKVFTWQELPLDGLSTQIRLTLQNDQASLLELVFLDREGSPVAPLNAADYPALFDEPDGYHGPYSFRNSMYFDEIYHGRTAYEFLNGLTSYENTHPPLGKIFIALGVWLFGMNPFGWRIAGTFFGILMVPALYLFARRISESTVLSTLACVLFAFDFMHFTQTRIATIDVFITFFVIFMYYFMYRYSCLSFYDTSLARTWLPLGACGVCMGFGIASKWTGVYAGGGLALIFFWTLYRRYREYLIARKDPEGMSGGISHAHILQSFRPCAGKTILFCLVFFVALPVLIYLLSYLPFRDYADRGLLARTLHNQQTMFGYHSNLESTHAFSSAWYEWPVIKRPIWYYSRVVTPLEAGGLREGISAFGNPAVWWPGIPAFLYMVFLWAARKDRTAAFLATGYLAQYLPWFFVTRTTFIYHYFPSVPFVVLMIMYSFAQWKKKAARPAFLAAVLLYGLLAVLLFLLFYPVLSGQPVEADFVARFLRWFPTWVLTAR